MILTHPSRLIKYLRRINKEDPQAILHAWQRIWQAEEAGELHRDYTIDFEKYDPDQTVAVFVATQQH